MTEKELKILEDLKAYLEWCMDHKDDVRFGEVMVTLAHDAGGILREEQFFSPRSSGYAKVMKRKAELETR